MSRVRKALVLGLAALLAVNQVSVVFASAVDKETVPTGVFAAADSTIVREEIKIRKKWANKPNQYAVRLSLVELRIVGDPVPLGEKDVLIADMTFVTELDNKQVVYSVPWNTNPIEAGSFVYACAQVIEVRTGEVVDELCDTLVPVPIF